MKKNILEIFSVGLAMFSMFFGAGNIIFPLAVGSYAGNQTFFAILGLIITAAIVPIGGMVAMILFDGDYKKFFGRLGNKVGFFLALIIISLLGPFGSTPRCIALSYSTLKNYCSISSVMFSLMSCGIIFLCAVRKRHLLSLLGFILTPLLLMSLGIIIFIGIVTPHDPVLHDHSKWNMFMYGLKEGYNTMDLLAAFFFSSSILSALKMKGRSSGQQSIFRTAVWASLIGSILLSTIYIGFCYLASFHGSSLTRVGTDALLMAITEKIAGPVASLLVGLTISLACLTTAIALIAAFADFIQKEVLKNTLSYEWIVFGSLVITFFICTFEFSGISTFLGPILQICYPGLIVLTILNIAHRWKKFQPLKLPVFCAFVISSFLFFLV